MRGPAVPGRLPVLTPTEKLLNLLDQLILMMSEDVEHMGFLNEPFVCIEVDVKLLTPLTQKKTAEDRGAFINLHC